MEDRAPRDLVLGVDVGGTFTDAVVIAHGVCFTAKVPSSEPQSEGVIAAARAALAAAGAPASAVGRFVHGMTVATNALLERKGASVVVVTTEGFADLLTIARQDREALYTLYPQRPVPLVAEGSVVSGARTGRPGRRPPRAHRPRDRPCDRRRRRAAPGGGGRLSAVELRLSPSTNVVWPRRSGRRCRACRSSVRRELAPVFREYERLSTTVVDAYVTPVTGGYLHDLAVALCLPRVAVSPRSCSRAGALSRPPGRDRHARPSAVVGARGRSASPRSRWGVVWAFRGC